MEFEKEKMEWLEFDLLESYPHITHGVFLRHGGTSKGSFGTLNVGEATSDHPDHIKVNRDQVRKALDIPHLVFPHQTHGTNVHRVTAKNLDKLPHADALFTTEKNIGLAITHADCQAAIFYDPVHEAIAVVHAGWRGSTQNIYSRVVDSLRRDIGTQPQNLIVCISPSLGPDHAEFKNYKQELPQDFWSFMIKPNYFDFWAISQKQLMAAGVLEKNIEITSICTYCNAKDYFSHRREKESGRHATVVALKG
jgi:YfiH family protein